MTLQKTRDFFSQIFSKFSFSRGLARPAWPWRHCLKSDWSVVTKGRYQSVSDPREGEISFGFTKNKHLRGRVGMTMSYCPPPPSCSNDCECSFGKIEQNIKGLPWNSGFKVVCAHLFKFNDFKNPVLITKSTEAISKSEWNRICFSSAMHLVRKVRP